MREKEKRRRAGFVEDKEEIEERRFVRAIDQNRVDDPTVVEASIRRGKLNSPRSAG